MILIWTAELVKEKMPDVRLIRNGCNISGTLYPCGSGVTVGYHYYTSSGQRERASFGSSYAVIAESLNSGQPLTA